MRLYKLTNKLVVRVKHKACEFLKGFSSNDLGSPRNTFLDVHGKIVATFDQKVLNEEEVLIVIESQFFERLKKHLDKYLMLSDTVLERDDYTVTFDVDGDYEAKTHEMVIPQRKGKLILSKEELPASLPDEHFSLFRLKHGIPVQGIDYDEEMLLNVGDEEFVSYTKGCYLGQEIIARVHHRSRPPKKLIARYEEECNPEEARRMTSKTLDPASGKILGFVFISGTG